MGVDFTGTAPGFRGGLEPNVLRAFFLVRTPLLISLASIFKHGSMHGGDVGLLPWLARSFPVMVLLELGFQK